MTTQAFNALLFAALAKAVPVAADESEADRAASLTIARTLFEAMKPADAIEAAQAARAVAAYMATMDNFARAAKPGVSDEKAVRLRSNAIGASRLFDSLVHPLRRPRLPVPALPPATAKTTAPTAGRTDWRGGTALTPVQPMVPVPG